MGVQPISVPQSLAYVLDSAGTKSGVDFGYLLQTAIRESSLDPKAKASTSSATGLFQFLESTWLQVMKDEGPSLGYGQYAEAITETADGEFTITDKTLREKVLKLREDPQMAADLAAAFTRSNGAYLQEKFGRMPSPGELYIAHFLGPKGAEKMFTAGLANSDEIFPSGTGSVSGGWSQQIAGAPSRAGTSASRAWAIRSPTAATWPRWRRRWATTRRPPSAAPSRSWSASRRRRGVGRRAGRRRFC